MLSPGNNEQDFLWEKMNKITKFVNEVKEELKKVTWPKRDEVIKLTLIVIFISAIIASYVGALDYGYTKLVEFILSK